jgi:hypothetical protein
MYMHHKEIEKLDAKQTRSRTRKLERAIKILNEVLSELETLEKRWEKRSAKTYELPSLDRCLEAMCVDNAARELGKLRLDASRAEH